MAGFEFYETMAGSFRLQGEAPFISAMASGVKRTVWCTMSITHSFAT